LPKVIEEELKKCANGRKNFFNRGEEQFILTE
jgi:hypothetical protein